MSTKINTDEIRSRLLLSGNYDTPNIIHNWQQLSALTEHLLNEIDRLNKVTDFMAKSAQSEAWAIKDVLAANMELSELVEQLRSVIHNYNGTEVYAVATLGITPMPSPVEPPTTHTEQAPVFDEPLEEAPTTTTPAVTEPPSVERSVDDIGALLGHLERLTSGVLERINAAIDVLAEPSDDRAEDIAYALAALRSAAQRLGA